MGLITQTPAYNLADGNKTFDPVALSENVAAIQVFYSDVNTDDVAAELHQSTDGRNFDVVDGSRVTIVKEYPSHTWNLSGLPNGIFIRVAIFKGSAAAGLIDQINILY